MTAKGVLKEYFGHECFREGQESVIEAVFSGSDAVAIMPTGGGKSVCYQVPSMIFDGVTIVISPLISLMKDQIHGLTESGISAAYINSTLSDVQVGKVLQNARESMYKIIYVAPERLMSERFLDFCYNTKVPFVAVDEAHCVSQWGQDFRPSYSAIPDFIAKFKTRPVVAAFTATATKKVQEDIVRILDLQKPSITLNSFDRKNLYFEVRHSKKRYDELKSILDDKKEQFGIVYCATRKAVEEVCEKLQADGYSASKYHAGLSDSLRHSAQDDFIYDKTNIIVATNAFGMGIDKSNVSFVVHYNMPKDIESYYQEAGRAGRDGNRAECVLLYNGQDLRTNLFLIENAEGRYYESEEHKRLLQEQERKRLKVMEAYCNTSACLRNYILNYFGENVSEDCQNCGNCLCETVEKDITIVSQKILSCIARTNEFYGRNTIIDILRGSKNEKIMRSGFASLPTYGICSETDAELKMIINYLVENEFLVFTNGQYPILKLGKYAAKVLKDRSPLSMRHNVEKNLQAEKARSAKKAKQKSGIADSGLLSELKALRRSIADEQNVPAYIIFHDSVLMEMSECMPTTLDDFAEISGIGKRKLEAYGEIFIEKIKNYMSKNGIVQKPRKSDLDNIPENKEKPKDKEQVVYSDILDLTEVEIYDGLVQLRDFVLAINPCLEKCGIKRIAPQTINDWLTEVGVLDSTRDEKGKIKRKLTELGKSCGMSEEMRVDANNEPYNMILYSKEVQQYIIDNFKSILLYRDSKKS